MNDEEKLEHLLALQTRVVERKLAVLTRLKSALSLPIDEQLESLANTLLAKKK